VKPRIRRTRSFAAFPATPKRNARLPVTRSSYEPIQHGRKRKFVHSNLLEWLNRWPWCGISHSRTPSALSRAVYKDVCHCEGCTKVRQIIGCEVRATEVVKRHHWWEAARWWWRNNGNNRSLASDLVTAHSDKKQNDLRAASCSSYKKLLEPTSDWRFYASGESSAGVSPTQALKPAFPSFLCMTFVQCEQTDSFVLSDFIADGLIKLQAYTRGTTWSYLIKIKSNREVHIVNENTVSPRSASLMYRIGWVWRIK